jgi:hypothetical protein
MDAMSLGRPMLCTYATQSGGKTIRSTVTVDGRKFRSVMDTGTVKAYGIFDGETQYSWTDGTRQGFKIGKDCLEDLKRNAPTDAKADADTVSPEAPNPSSIFDLATDVECGPADAADFSVPADIVFADQCEVLDQGDAGIPSMPERH